MLPLGNPQKDPDMTPEQIIGARIGFAIISVISVIIILGLALPIFCPHTFDKFIAYFNGQM